MSRPYGLFSFPFFRFVTRHSAFDTLFLSAIAPPILHIDLLGDFRLTYRGEAVTSVNTERLQSLLAYLALHRGTPQARRHLAFSFWPDSRETQAYNNLRNVLYRLRKALPDADHFLEADATSLCWRDDAPFTLDVAAFEHHLAQAQEALQQGDASVARAVLEEAVRLYRGDLLTGLYDDWILPERERLHQACTRALEQLIQLLETSRHYGPALQHAQRLVHLDPLREPTYRLLMRLHALNQDRAGALRVYQQCVEILKRELDLEPEPATIELWQQITNVRDLSEAEPRSSEASSETPVHEIPLVGRHSEWKRLREAWRAAADGHARLLTVTGEAGIGKTRLAEELIGWAGRQGIATAQARCYAAEGHLAYAPVVTWLRADALRANQAVLDAVWLAELARLLPEVQAEHPDLPAPGPLRERWQRQRLFEALARAVLAAGRPLLLFLDDLQWCDQDTLEWLRFLMRFGEAAPLLVLGTVRTEEAGPEHPLQALRLDLARTGQVTEIALAPLDGEETARLAAQIANTELGEAQSDRLYRETEGNPLFVVESVRAGLPPAEVEEIVPGVSIPPARPLPAKVHAVIEKRLDRLSPTARALAGLAAVTGRAFNLEVLAQTSPLDEDALVEALDELWQARIIQEYGAAAYDFTHDKLREVAYAEISPVRRRLLHRRIAETLEAVHADDPDAVVAQVAVHYERAGLRERAIACYERAAAAAEHLGSHRETVQLLSRAVELLDTLSENRQRNEQKLALLIRLGLAVRLTEGHAAASVGEVFERAHRLCEQVGDAPEHFVVQRGLWSFHLLRGAYRTAQTLAEELLALADRVDDEALHLEAYVALGLTTLWQGALTQSRAYLERSLALYDPQRHRTHAVRYGQDPGVASYSLLAYAECLLGHPSQAAEHMQAALDLARELAHPFSRSYALQHAMLVAHGSRQSKATREHAEALLQLSRERGFAYWLGPGMIGQGWALAEQDQPLKGLSLIQQGLAEHHAKGARLSSTLWLGMLAEAMIQSGKVDDALRHVERALALAEETGERIWEAELYRLKGDLLLRQGADSTKAESHFERALAVARQQQAKALELRAAMSLGRLRHRQGQTAEARGRLQEIMAWFTDGSDVPDLTEANILLDRWA